MVILAILIKTAIFKNTMFVYNISNNIVIDIKNIVQVYYKFNILYVRIMFLSAFCPKRLFSGFSEISVFLHKIRILL